MITVSSFEVDREKYIIGFINLNFTKEESYNFFTDVFDPVNKMLAVNPDIHYIVDISNLGIVYENTSILNYFGYEEKDLNNARIIDFLNDKIDMSNITSKKSQEGVHTSEILEGFIQKEFKILTKNEGWKWVKSRSIDLIKKDDLNVNLKYVILQDITETKSIEEELNRNNAFLKDITNLVPDMIVVFKARPFEIVYSNLNEGTLLGYNESEWKYFEHPKPFPGHEDDFIRSLEEIYDIQEGEMKIHEVPFISKSGEKRWLLSRSKLFKKDPITNEVQILSIIIDVQDYRSAIESLKISEDTNNAIISAIPDLILVVNRKGDYLNTFSGYNMKVSESDGIIGQNIVDWIEQPYADLIIKNIELCIDNDKLYQIEYEMYSRLYNKEVYYSNYFSRLSDDTAIIVVRDIAESKAAERELDAKMELLSEQNKILFLKILN